MLKMNNEFVVNAIYENLRKIPVSLPCKVNHYDLTAFPRGFTSVTWVYLCPPSPATWTLFYSASNVSLRCQYFPMFVFL